MDSLTIFRIIKHGARNFVRHIWLSLASTLVTTLTLIMLSSILIMYGLVSYALDSVRDKVDISVYFKLDVIENKALSIKEQIERLPKVESVAYVSAQESLEAFKSKHRTDPDLLASLGELDSNPLPATLHVKAETIEDYPTVVNDISALGLDKYIEKVNYEDNRSAIERLGKVLGLITWAGFAVALVFAAVSVLVIFNTIALTIVNRSFEVEIMRLVGATNFYIQGPFLIESFMYSLCATLVAAIVLIPMYMKVLPDIMPYISVNSALTLPEVLIFPSTNLFILTLFMFIVSFALSGITAMFAMRKYLKR